MMAKYLQDKIPKLLSFLPAGYEQPGGHFYYQSCFGVKKIDDFNSYFIINMKICTGMVPYLPTSFRTVLNRDDNFPTPILA